MLVTREHSLLSIRPNLPFITSSTHKIINLPFKMKHHLYVIHSCGLYKDSYDGVSFLTSYSNTIVRVLYVLIDLMHRSISHAQSAFECLVILKYTIEIEFPACTRRKYLCTILLLITTHV